MSLSDREFQVLSLLASEPRKGMYGLQLVEESGGDIPRGTVYVTLNRLVHQRLAESRLEEGEGQGPARRYFTITPAGKQLLALQKKIQQLTSLNLGPARA